MRGKLAKPALSSPAQLLSSLAQILSSRGTKRSRPSVTNKRRKERLPRYARLLVIARNEAISPFSCQQTEKGEIASQARNDRILRSPSCHREERSDLGFTGLTNRENRDCHASLAMTGSCAHLLVIARYEAIPPLLRRQSKKGEIASQARNDSYLLRFARPPVIARYEAISPFSHQQTEKREIATLRSQ